MMWGAQLGELRLHCTEHHQAKKLPKRTPNSFPYSKNTGKDSHTKLLCEGVRGLSHTQNAVECIQIGMGFKN